MNQLQAFLELLTAGGFSIASINPKVTFYRGDDIKIKYWIRGLAGRVVSIAGYTITATIGGVVFPSTVTASASGQGEFTLNATATDALAAGIYDCILTLTNDSTTAKTRIKLPNVIEAKDLA